MTRKASVNPTAEIASEPRWETKKISVIAKIDSITISKIMGIERSSIALFKDIFVKSTVLPERDSRKSRSDFFIVFKCYSFINECFIDNSQIAN